MGFDEDVLASLVSLRARFDSLASEVAEMRVEQRAVWDSWERHFQFHRELAAATSELDLLTRLHDWLTPTCE